MPTKLPPAPPPTFPEKMQEEIAKAVRPLTEPPSEPPPPPTSAPPEPPPPYLPEEPHPGEDGFQKDFRAFIKDVRNALRVYSTFSNQEIETLRNNRTILSEDRLPDGFDVIKLLSGIINAAEEASNGTRLPVSLFMEKDIYRAAANFTMLSVHQTIAEYAVMGGVTEDPLARKFAELYKLVSNIKEDYGSNLMRLEYGFKALAQVLNDEEQAKQVAETIFQQEKPGLANAVEWARFRDAGGDTTPPEQGGPKREGDSPNEGPPKSGGPKGGHGGRRGRG